MPRPVDTTDKSIFEGNGRNVNYCELPVLDGSGKRANDIPKAYTPGCALEDVPLPILAECTEPLAPGVVDMRGLWRGISGRVGHLERIEQCGNRVVVTAYGIIHDFRLDGTLENGARDVGALCNNFHTAIHVNEEGIMVFRLFDWFDTVTRKMDGENMIFTFIDGIATRTERAMHVSKRCASGILKRVQYIGVSSQHCSGKTAGLRIHWYTRIKRSNVL